MKKIVILIILVLAGILVYGYTIARSPIEPPAIKITIGDKQIDYIAAKNEWNGAKYDREDTFKTLIKKGTEIPYIKPGSNITISFVKNPPRDFTISDILIDENGNQRYTYREIINIPAELKNGKASFELKKHIASGLSSYHVEGKTDIRGFRMIAKWGENECEYAFIIRSDAF